MSDEAARAEFSTFAGHLRNVHFTLVVTCLAILIAITARVEVDSQAARSELTMLRALTELDPFWLRDQMFYELEEKKHLRGGKYGFADVEIKLRFKTDLDQLDNVLLKLKCTIAMQRLIFFDAGGGQVDWETNRRTLSGALAHWDEMYDISVFKYVHSIYHGFSEPYVISTGTSVDGINLRLRTSSVDIRERSSWNSEEPAKPWQLIYGPSEFSYRDGQLTNSCDPRFSTNYVTNRGSDFESALTFIYDTSADAIEAALAFSRTSFDDDSQEISHETLGGGLDYIEVGVGLPLDVETINVNELISIVLKKNNLNPIFDESFDGSSDQALPNLSAFSETLGSANLDEVQNFLDALIQIEESKQTIDLFGAKIPKPYFSVWGVVVLAAIHLYFTLHITAFSRLGTSGSYYFPWIVLYDGKLPRVASFASLVILPLLVVAVSLVSQIEDIRAFSNMAPVSLGAGLFIVVTCSMTGGILANPILPKLGESE